MKYVFALICCLALVGCGGGSSGSNVTGSARIECTDVANEGGTDCQPVNPTQAPAGAWQPITIVDAGVVSRGTIIEVTMAVLNDSSAPFRGWYEMEFDAGCNGAPTWPITSGYTSELAPGETWSGTVGGACGDMPLGQRTLTATLFDDMNGSIIDQTVVTFDLTE